MVKHKLDTALPLESSLQNILLGCISFIHRSLREEADVHSAIHEARRTMKRIRSVLRLVRDEIGYSAYYRENRLYRNLSARLSGARDTYVLLQLLDEYRNLHPGSVTDRDHARLRPVLERRLNHQMEQFGKESGGFESLLEELEEGARRVHSFCRVRDNFSSINQGIRRTYRKARSQLACIRKEFRKAEFHEYRKNTKYFLHQMELLQPVYPNVIKGQVRSLDHHATILGDTRDLERLERFFRSDPEIPWEKDRREKLAAPAKKCLKERLGAIIADGERIYAEDPKRFVRRISAYWDATRKKTETYNPKVSS